MRNALAVGKISGISIFIHWTFPIIILWIIFTNVRQGHSTEQISRSVAFVLVLFICVILHELGHALAARRFDIKTKDITLLPIGGVARLENMPENPLVELLVAFAGPAVNIVIFIVLYFSFVFSNIPFSFTGMVRITGENFVYNLALLNLWVAVFNLIPAFPMDGGRVLRAILSMRIDRLFANQIVAAIGNIIAIIFVGLGFFYNPFLILIGLFIFLSARSETQEDDHEFTFLEYAIEEVASTNYHVLHKSDSIEKAVQLFLDEHVNNVVVMDGLVPYGTLSLHNVLKALSNGKGNTTVDTVTDVNPVYVESNETIEDAVLLMQEHKVSLLLVTKNREFIGVLDQQSILTFCLHVNDVAGD